MKSVNEKDFIIKMKKIKKINTKLFIIKMKKIKYLSRIKVVNCLSIYLFLLHFRTIQNIAPFTPYLQEKNNYKIIKVKDITTITKYF